jgi:hypothetical protein
MTTLHKELARFAPECRQVDTDHWQLALSNGHALSVSVERDGGLLLLDADTGLSPVADRWVPLSERSAELRAAVKFALRGGGPTMRLRAELSLTEDGVAGDRIRRNLDGMRTALDWLHESVSCKAAGVSAACPPAEDGGQAVPGGLAELVKEPDGPIMSGPAPPCWWIWKPGTTTSRQCWKGWTGARDSA